MFLSAKTMHGVKGCVIFLTLIRNWGRHQTQRQGRERESKREG